MSKMPRRPNLSLSATNHLLDLIQSSSFVGAGVESELKVSARLGVSRLVARSVLQNLEGKGVLQRIGRVRSVARMPVEADYYHIDQTESRSDAVERRFMQIAQSGSLLPGQHFTETEIARSFGASTVSVREFLIGFSKYGLVEKASQGGWRFCAFDESFARELASLRSRFEIDGIGTFAQLGANDLAWREVEALLAQHNQMRGNAAEIIASFSGLDRAFHHFIIEKLHNRFVNSLFGVVSFVFHFHYQWRKDTELSRNTKAIDEHIVILEALRNRDVDAAVAGMKDHLATSLRTMLQSAMREGT